MYIHEYPHPRVIVHYHPSRRQFTLDDVRFALAQEVHALELDLHLRQQDSRVVCNHDRATAASPCLEQVADLVLSKKGDSATVNHDGHQFFLVLEPKNDDAMLFDGILKVLQRYAVHFSTAVSEGDAPRGITVVISGEFRHMFLRHFPPEQINRLCIVEDHNYEGEIVNLAEHQTPFQWVTFRSGGERGRVNRLHTGTDPQLEGRYNVRVWDCSSDDLGLCLASGVDQINCNRDQVEELARLIRGQTPIGRFPALAVRGSQALLTWRGRSSNNLHVALGTVGASGLSFERQIVMTHLLADELLVLSPAAALAADGQLVILYEALSDRTGVVRLWHRFVQGLPISLARLLRTPQSLRYVAGRFISFERFVTFDGRERRLTRPSGTGLRGRDPAVAVGPEGRLLIVYESISRQGLRYFSATLSPEGELAGQDCPLVEGEICLGFTPAIAIDQAGRVVVVFQSPGDQGLMYVSGAIESSGRIQGRRFMLTLGNARRGSRPSVALDGNGQVIVAYQQGRDAKLWYVSGILDESGCIIGEEFPLTDSQLTAGEPRQGSHPTVTFDGEGRILILYEELTARKFWYAHGPIQAGLLSGQQRLLSIGMERR